MEETSDMFTKFLAVCKVFLDKDSYCLLQFAQKRFDECKSDFVTSQQFRTFLSKTQVNIVKDSGKIFVHLKDLMNYMKPYCSKKRKKNISRSEAQQQKKKRKTEVISDTESSPDSFFPSGSDSDKAGVQCQTVSRHVSEDSDGVGPVADSGVSEDSHADNYESREEESTALEDICTVSLLSQETEKSSPMVEEDNWEDGPSPVDAVEENSSSLNTGNQNNLSLQDTVEDTEDIGSTPALDTVKDDTEHDAAESGTDSVTFEVSGSDSNEDDNEELGLSREEMQSISQLMEEETIVIDCSSDEYDSEQDQEGDLMSGKDGCGALTAVKQNTVEHSEVRRSETVTSDAEVEILSLSHCAVSKEDDTRDSVKTVVKPECDPIASTSAWSLQTVNERDSTVVKGSRRQIQRLEKLLEDLRDKIEKVGERELDLDALNDEASDYILEEKLKSKFVKVWNKLCELHNSAPTTGRPQERAFRYEGSRYPDVNRRITKFINRKKMFPDYQDVRNLLMKVNREKVLRLRKQELDNLAREVFTDVGNHLQQRRQQDFACTFPVSTIDPYSPYDDPALLDRELRRKLENNKKTAKSNMEEVIEKYSRLQQDRKTVTSSGEEMDAKEKEEEDGGLWESVGTDNPGFHDGISCVPDEDDKSQNSHSPVLEIVNDASLEGDNSDIEGRLDYSPPTISPIQVTTIPSDEDESDDLPDIRYKEPPSYRKFQGSNSVKSSGTSATSSMKTDKLKWTNCQSVTGNRSVSGRTLFQSNIKRFITNATKLSQPVLSGCARLKSEVASWEEEDENSDLIEKYVEPETTSSVIAGRTGSSGSHSIVTSSSQPIVLSDSD